ncbi:MAG: CopG family transcriptional regulator [DPANN group archaeon]|nr:CopG family transcriptional regulator [DPANN group archaeon]
MISVFKELDKEKTIISIPRMLAQKIHNQIKKTDFTTISEYTTYILREVLSESIEKEKISKSDEEKVKERLKGLGYLE